MDIDFEAVNARLRVLSAAKEIVDPIVEKNPLKEHRVGQAFSTTSVFSPADQHVDLCIRVANWLIEEE